MARAFDSPGKLEPKNKHWSARIWGLHQDQLTVVSSSPTSDRTLDTRANQEKKTKCEIGTIASLWRKKTLVEKIHCALILLMQYHEKAGGGGFSPLSVDSSTGRKQECWHLKNIDSSLHSLNNTNDRRP